MRARRISRNVANYAKDTIMAYRTPELQLVGAAQLLVLQDSETAFKVPRGATFECPDLGPDELSQELYDVLPGW
jgi:hypothetical protein